MTSPPDLAQCRWPALAEPYQTALHQAVSFVLAGYQPVAIVAGGSLLRGQGDAFSDLDIYVVHQAGWRQRVQKRFNRVAAEIFINPPQQVRRYFSEERKDGRPITAHLLTTGFVVLEKGEILGELQNEAAVVLQQRPDLSPEALEFQRYMTVDLLDNVADMVERSPHTALFVLEQAMQCMITHAYLTANHNLPRLKETLDRLDEVEPGLRALAQRYYAGESLGQKHAAALEFAQRVLGATAFYEWMSQPDSVPD